MTEMDTDLRIREAVARLAATIPTTAPDDVLARVATRRRSPAGRPARGVPAVAGAAAALAVAAALVVAAVALTGRGEETSRVDTASDEPPQPSPPPPGWERLSDSGPSRSRAAVVSTGEELAVWGEVLDGDAPEPHLELWPLRPDGSGEDGPRLSSPAPLSPTWAGHAVWTGSVIVVVDSGAAAAYDPDDDAWSTLPAPPATVSRSPAVTVWTGQEVIVWGERLRGTGGGSAGGQGARGAAWNPAERRWRAIAEAPIAVNQGGAVWTGDELVIVGAHLDQNNRPVPPSPERTAVALAYDPAANRWRRLPDPPLSPQASAVAVSGGELIAWDYLLGAARYDMASGADRWESLPRLPLDDQECEPQTAATPDHVLALYCGQAAVLDLATGRWQPVDLPAPAPGGPLVADDDRILAAVGTAADGDAAGDGDAHGTIWAFHPSELGA